MAHMHVAGNEVSSDIVSASEAALILDINVVDVYIMKYRGFIASIQVARGKGVWKDACVQGFSLKEIRAVLDGNFQDLDLERMTEKQLWLLISGCSSRERKYGSRS